MKYQTRTLMNLDTLTLDSFTRTEEGYLKFEKAKLARTGIQEYLAIELGGIEGKSPMDVIRVYRPPEEVFDKESMDSFALKPITDDHPPEMLNSKLVKQYSIGTVGEKVSKEGDYLVASLLFTDAQAISNIEKGKRELSNGYFSDYIAEPGVTPEGEPYDMKQVNIRGNHVALVDQGRCGGSCRIMDASLLDHKPCNCQTKEETFMNEVTLNVAGVDCKMSEQVSQIVQKALRDAASTKEDLDNKVKDLEEKLEAAKKERDELKSEKENTDKELKEAKDQLKPENLRKHLDARNSFEKKVKAFDEKFQMEGKDDIQVMKEVLAVHDSEFDAEGKSDDYIRAYFDSTYKALGAKDTGSDQEFHKAVSGAGNTDSNPEKVSAEDSRKNMIDRNRESWKTKPSQ